MVEEMDTEGIDGAYKCLRTETWYSSSRHTLGEQYSRVYTFRVYVDIGKTAIR
jgi:hypothetical protein